MPSQSLGTGNSFVLPVYVIMDCMSMSIYIQQYMYMHNINLYTWPTNPSDKALCYYTYYAFVNLYTFFQTHVPEQIKKVLNAEFTDDNHLFTPLKKFPETFSEAERCIFLQIL